MIHKFVGRTRTCLCGEVEVEDPVKKYHLFYRRKKDTGGEQPTFDSYEKTRQEEEVSGSGETKQ